MSVEAAFTAKEVAAHSERSDCWMTIHGEVYNVTDYLQDHPGGIDIMLEVAGKDASEAFDSAGHSEDAFDIMAPFRVGTFKGTPAVAPKAVRIAVKKNPQQQQPKSKTSAATKTTAAAVVSLGTLTAALLSLRNNTKHFPKLLSLATSTTVTTSSTSTNTFTNGFLAATALALLATTITARKLSALLLSIDHVRGTFTPHRPHRALAAPNPLLARGYLDPVTYKPLPLIEKTLLAPQVYRFVFALPTPDTVLGLPIGQHVAIKAETPAGLVTRSYTPTSNNADRGVLILVVKCYPDGALSGGYLAHLTPGIDEVLFRGPKGAMQYQRGWATKIAMLAGGTGITPLYQVLRAICEDPRDTTEVSLVYANRSEADILLREELEALARRYPRSLRLLDLFLDQPGDEWKGGRGYVTREVMAERFPDSKEQGAKVMLCGPPGMVNAAKKGLAELGWEMPGLVAKMSDQVFCF